MSGRSGDDSSNAPLRDLFLRFESLGGHGHGCEFGLAQRHFGAEPLGLLRWADLHPDLLIKALNCRFEGVGEPEYTEISQQSDGEYWTADTRFHMAMRTFTKVTDIPYDKMVIRACQRLRFLRDKLISDLQEGTKIFCFRDMKKNLTDDEINN